MYICMSVCMYICRMKIQPTEWEKIFGMDATDKGLISQIYTSLRQLNIKKKSKKIGRRSQ